MNWKMTTKPWKKCGENPENWNYGASRIEEVIISRDDYKLNQTAKINP